MLFYVGLLFAILALITFVDAKFIRNYVKVHGPHPLPIVGNALAVIGTGRDFFLALERYWKQYGTRFRIYIGNQLFLLLSSPADVEVVLNSMEFIEKSVEYKYLHSWLGTGLLTSTGEKWRKRRKVITPTFHFKILEYFIQVFNSQSDVLISKLKRHVDKKSFDVYPDVTLCALDIISEAAMGVTIDAQKDSHSEYVTAVKEMCRIINSRQKNPFKRIDLIFFFTADYWIAKKSLNILHGFTDKMIKERRDLLTEKNEKDDDHDSGIGAKKKLAFLDMLLLSTIDGKPMTDLDIREEVDTFLFEGHDTTTSGISFALYLLAHYPEVQKKAYDELKDIFGDDYGRPATLNELNDMKYMELVIKEALRMYPPVPIIGRKVNQNMKINDIAVPAGTTTILMIYHMNRNPEVFREPNSFIPERHLPDEANKRSPYASVPFSAGPRNCIGQKFAILEMKSTISKVLRRFELLPSGEDVILSADVILKSVNGVRIKIKDRSV